ncbi:MAG: NAD(P)H-binding protein [Bacteroidota bacterium]
MMRTLITGATGNIGQPLLQYLKAFDLPFTAGLRTITGKEDFPTVPLDFQEVKSLKNAFQGHDILFLLMPESDQVEQWMEHALEAARDAQIKHIIRSSGYGADASSTYFVFNTLGQLEDQVKASGINYTMVRPNSFLQNFANYRSQAIKAGTVYMTHQEETQISYVDVRDVALAIAQIIKAPHQHVAKTYTITGGTAITDRTLVDAIATVLNKPIEVVYVSDEDTIASLRTCQVPEYEIKQLVSLYQADKAGQTAEVYPDFEILTGRQPRTVHDFAKAYQAVWK